MAHAAQTRPLYVDLPQAGNAIYQHLQLLQKIVGRGRTRIAAARSGAPLHKYINRPRELAEAACRRATHMPSPKLSPAVARTAMVVDVDIAGHAARAGGGSKQPPRRMHGRRHGRRPRPHRRRFRKPEPNIVCVALENAECAPLATLLLSLAQKPPAGPGGVAFAVQYL